MVLAPYLQRFRACTCFHKRTTIDRATAPRWRPDICRRLTRRHSNGLPPVTCPPPPFSVPTVDFPLPPALPSRSTWAPKVLQLLPPLAVPPAPPRGATKS